MIIIVQQTRKAEAAKIHFESIQILVTSGYGGRQG